VKGEDIRVELASDPRLLQAVRRLVHGYLGAYGLPADRCDEVVLAVDEACANSIRHSYGGRREGTLRLSLRCEGQDIFIVLRDQGKPIPAEFTAARELAPPDLDTLTPGGLGVGLIYRVFDEVDYRPGKERGNCVTMRLRCAEP